MEKGWSKSLSREWEGDLDAEESQSADISYKNAVTVVIHLSSYIFAAFHFLALPIAPKRALEWVALRSSEIVSNKSNIANYHMTDLQPATVKCKTTTKKAGHKNSLSIRHLKSLSIPAKAI